ncbi:MAG: hypothetical protein NT027_12105 [Proteobacteria bacterium]|nr:hypothetical protein [Pseudomonadota bacterium]
MNKMKKINIQMLTSRRKFEICLVLALAGCSQSETSLSPLSRVSSDMSKDHSNELDSASLSAAASENGFRFNPPALSNPIRVLIEKDGGAYPAWRTNYPKTKEKIKMLHGRMIEAPVGAAASPEYDVSQYYFPFDRDVEVTVKMPLLLKEPIQIFGGRNVVIRGSGDGYIVKELSKGMPAKCDHSLEDCKNKLNDYRPNMSAAFIIDSPRNSVLIENVKVKLGGDFTDAFAFRQNPATNPKLTGVDVFFRNVEALEIGGAYPASRGHGDIVQLQSGSYRNLFFEKFVGSTGYQGFYLPNRPKGHSTLCKVVSELKPNAANEKDRWDVKICTPPMEVKGQVYLQNVVLRPIDPSLCIHCVKPYIGLWTVDPPSSQNEPASYQTFLNDVTFYRDARRPVNGYIVPQPAWTTPEGVINMTVETKGVIKGKLTVITEKK